MKPNRLLAHATMTKLIIELFFSTAATGRETLGFFIHTQRPHSSGQPGSGLFQQPDYRLGVTGQPCFSSPPSKAHTDAGPDSGKHTVSLFAVPNIRCLTGWWSSLAGNRKETQDRNHWQDFLEVKMREVHHGKSLEVSSDTQRTGVCAAGLLPLEDG